MPDEEKDDQPTLQEYLDMMSENPEDPRLTSFRRGFLAYLERDKEGRKWLEEADLEIQRRKSRSHRTDLRRNKG